MTRSLRTLLLSTAVAALTFAPLPAFMPIGSDPAFAERGGNGNGKGGERGNGGEKGNGGASAGDHGKSNGSERSAAKGGAAKGGERSRGDGPSSFSKKTEVEVASGKSSKRKSAPAIDDETEVASLSPKKEKTSHGALASELKGLNAYHASAQAFENASANSQVGRIAAYRDAALQLAALDGLIETRAQELADAKEAEDAARALQDAYDPAYAGPTTAEIDASIGALDPTSETYEADLQALEQQRLAAEAFETGPDALAEAVAMAEADRIEADGALTQANADVEAATLAEEDALMAASNGRTLSPEALAYLREQLGL